jgi:hypothetical protein
VLIILISFLMVKRRKDHKKKQDELLSQQPEFSKPTVYPAVINQQIPNGAEPTYLQQTVYSTPQVPSTTYTYEQPTLPLVQSTQSTLALPPAQIDIDQETLTPVDGQELPSLEMAEVEVESESSQMEDEQIIVDEPLASELETYVEPDIKPDPAPEITLPEEDYDHGMDSVFPAGELLHDDTEYLAAESPELVKDSRPLFTVSFPEESTPDFQPSPKSIAEPETTGETKEQPKTQHQTQPEPKPEPKPNKKAEHKIKFLEVS